MPSRPVRSAAALALATSATSFAYVGTAAPAQAAGYNGVCKTSSGVTVVVDFRELGGGIAVRCSPVGSGANGQQALQAAGIPVVEPRLMHGFVCRLYGAPSASTTLPGGYHEQCVNTTPLNAHWWYSQAPNGGSWSSSSTGYTSSQVIPGGFEGWAFSEGGTNYAPRFTPTRPAAPKPPPTHTATQPPASARHTTTTAPKYPKTTAPNGNSTSSKGGSSGSQANSTTASKSSTEAKKAAEKKAAAKASRSASASSSSTAKHSTGSSSSAGGAAGSSSGGPTNVAGAPMANSDNLIKDSKKSSGINATTVVGGGVLAALALGGGAVAVIRRRNLE